MTKTISAGSRRTPGKVSGSAKTKSLSAAKAVKRNASTGQFVLGRKAFASISAVEGIHLSQGLDADLARLASVPSHERLRVLSRKYGKK
jgi:hypothetical protein